MLRKTERDGDFRHKTEALKESLKSFRNQWEAFTKKEMELFLQYTLDGVASREFFLGHYEKVLESFDPTGSFETAREKFSRRLDEVIMQLNPRFIDEDTGKSIYDGGRHIKNRALSDLIHWLMIHWKNSGGQKITNSATHPAVDFAQEAIKNLVAHAVIHGSTEQKAFLDKSHDKVTSIYRRLAKEYKW